MGNDNPSETDPPIQRAITQLGICALALTDVQFEIRAMIDDVLNARDSESCEDVLLMWNIGKDRVGIKQQILNKCIEEATDFMDSPPYDSLDSIKKAQYWDTLNKTTRDKEKLAEEYDFYCLFSSIEHTEHTIAFLWKNLKIYTNNYLARKRAGNLTNRGLSRQKHRILFLKDSLHHQIDIVLGQIDGAIRHRQFATLGDERRQEYHAKWKLYQEGLRDINQWIKTCKK